MSPMEPVEYTTDRHNEPGPIVHPTNEQEERRARLRRFNRWVLYFPVGLVVAGWLVLIGVLIWLAVAGDWFAMDTNQSDVRQLVSGVADVFTMLMLVPPLLLCAVPIVASVALVIVRRQRAADKAAGSPSLPLFWRIENVITSVRDTVADTMPRLANPVINAHATAAFIKRFFIVLKRTISQEIFGNDDRR